MLSCSKGSRGLFVPLRVIGIFTDTTISPNSRLRQCPDHYTIRAGRNLPDKEFRYLRTVIVTAAVYRGLQFNASLAMTSPLNLPAPGRCQAVYFIFKFCTALCFCLNSCLDLFSAPHLTGDPFSRSYRVNLPSSLTVNLSSALVYSTRLRVSVWSTGDIRICLADFLGSLLTTAIRLPGGSRYCQFRHTTRICLGHVYLPPLTCYSVSRRVCHFSVSTSLLIPVTES